MCEAVPRPQVPLEPVVFAQSRTDPIAPEADRPRRGCEGENSPYAALAVLRLSRPRLLRRGLQRRGPVDLGDVMRRLVHDRAEVLAEQFVGLEARQSFDGVGEERQAGVGPDRPDQVGRVLDEVAVALFGCPQLALQAGALGDVADRALRSHPAPVLEHAGRRDLGRERRPVAPDEREQDPLDEVRVPAHGRVLVARDRHRVGVRQSRVFADVRRPAAEQRPAESAMNGTPHRHPPPDHVGGRLHGPRNLLPLVHAREVRVRSDGCLIARPCRRSRSRPRTRVLRRRDRQRYDHIATRCSQRRGSHADQPPAGDGLVVGSWGCAGRIVRRQTGLRLAAAVDPPPSGKRMPRSQSLVVASEVPATTTGMR